MKYQTMKYMWISIAVICTLTIAGVLLSGLTEHLIGKILLAFSSAFLASSIMNMIKLRKK